MKSHHLQLIKKALLKSRGLDDQKDAQVLASVKRLDHFLKIKNLKKARNELEMLTRSIIEVIKN